MRTRITAKAAFVGAITHEPVYPLRNDISGEQDAWNGEAIRRLLQYEDLFFEKWDEGKELITIDRLRELAEAERDGRVVVLPVAVDELAYTPEGDAIVKNWDITARVEFCVPHRSGMYWSDRYSDFDILDILNPEAESDRALAEKGGAT